MCFFVSIVHQFNLYCKYNKFFTSSVTPFTPSIFCFFFTGRYLLCEVSLKKIRFSKLFATLTKSLAFKLKPTWSTLKSLAFYNNVIMFWVPGNFWKRIIRRINQRRIPNVIHRPGTMRTCKHRLEIYIHHSKM